MNTSVAQVAANPSSVINILSKYDSQLVEAKDVFELEGKRLEELCRDHAKNVVFYKQSLNDLKSLEDYYKVKAEEISGKHWKKYNEKHSRALASKDIQQYISSEDDYVKQWELIIEVANMRKQYEAVVDALSDMSWMLGHMTKLKIAELEDALL